MCGFLLIDKPLGVTSHDVVKEVRRRLGVRRVGHAGTLDPVCTGLLVLGVGRATRLLRFLSLEPKEYEGVMKLGEATTTQDAEGEVVRWADASKVDSNALCEAAREMVGKVRQVPPMYSAVKVGGRKLYEYARAGKEVDREARTVTIHGFKVLSLDLARAESRTIGTPAYPSALARFWVRCSSGTYVRTLVHDLGQKVGVGAHVVELRRTAAGVFRVEDALQLEEVSAEQLLPPEDVLEPMPMARLPGRLAEVAANGGAVRVPYETPGRYLGLLDPDGRLIAVARETDRGWQPEVVLPRDSDVRR
ncbi:MAG: tRNA pseudouridine(55) synthase TruB [Armatimonadota bacterium]